MRERYSVNDRLMRLAVGDTLFTETTRTGYANKMRQLSPATTRRPPQLQGKTFTSTLYTAIAASDPGDVRYIIRTERTE